MAELFGLGALTGGDAEERVEDLAADLFDGGLAVGNAAGISLSMANQTGPATRFPSCILCASWRWR